MIHAGDEHRVTVVFESRAAGSATHAERARAADAATHPTLLAELARTRVQGYLAD